MTACNCPYCGVEVYKPPEGEDSVIREYRNSIGEGVCVPCFIKHAKTWASREEAYAKYYRKYVNQHLLALKEGYPLDD